VHISVGIIIVQATYDITHPAVVYKD